MGAETVNGRRDGTGGVGYATSAWKARWHHQWITRGMTGGMRAEREWMKGQKGYMRYMFQLVSLAAAWCSGPEEGRSDLPEPGVHQP